VHVIVIGSSADRYLIQQIAKVCKSLCKITGPADDFRDVIMRMLIGCLKLILDGFQVDYDSSIFENGFFDNQDLYCFLKDEIFNLHLFLKPLVKLTDLTEAQRTIKVSYFDSSKNAKEDRLI